MKSIVLIKKKFLLTLVWKLAQLAVYNHIFIDLLLCMFLLTIRHHEHTSHERKIKSIV